MSSTGTSRRSGFWGRVLRSVIPARTRRVVVLASLYALLLDKEPTMQQLTALNDSLSLAKWPDSLKMPARIPTSFWKNGDDIKKVADITDRETLILARIRPWLVYGNKLDIGSDVRTLLQFVETRQTGVAVGHVSRENLKIVATV